FLMNGFILNFLKRYEIQDSMVMLILTLVPNACNLLLLIPLAHYSDLQGKKKIGAIGNGLHALGFSFFGLIYFFPNQALVLSILAISLFSFGLTCFLSNWFALLHPLIEPSTRGRFFAWLRISWQIICIIATFIVAKSLKVYDSNFTYLVIILIISFALFLRIYFYWQVPEFETKKLAEGSIKEGIRQSFENKPYRRFCIFIFLYMFFCFGALPFLNLFERESLSFTDSEIISMGYIAQLGALVGFWFGARLVDKSRITLLLNGSVFSSIIILFLFAFGVIKGEQTVLMAGALTFAFSVTFNSIGIAMTTEAMRLVKSENKSLGISLSMTMTAAGAALSGLVSSIYLDQAKALELSLGTFNFNHYQLYLLICAVGLLLVLLLFKAKQETT
ncbi:MAG: MFS transporter, partial [Lentisphaeraceae bacterium]|nr:MFS transporter [Lentisphaeraceae bacterium]